MIDINGAGALECATSPNMRTTFGSTRKLQHPPRWPNCSRRVVKAPVPNQRRRSKTLLAMGFLVRGATEHDEAGVFMSFEETGEKLPITWRR